MFKRKNEDDESVKPGADEAPSAPPMKPFSKRGSHAPPKAQTSVSRPNPGRPVDIPSATRRFDRLADTDGRKLIVGRSIELSGVITSCDKLVVEGTVEANIEGARIIEVAQGGVFRGKASVDEADISGLFDGELLATKRLIVRSTGQIQGTVRYAGIVIEPGGELHGNVQVIDEGTTEPPQLTAPKK